MELVYLWVEKYKNIRNQGFNFSPRFECEFKDSNLTISDKKKNECKNNEYLENFFGKNINVTAIVGENGSGKSSLIKLIFLLIYCKKYESLDLNDPKNSERQSSIIKTARNTYLNKNIFLILAKKKSDNSFEYKKISLLHTLKECYKKTFPLPQVNDEEEIKKMKDCTLKYKELDVKDLDFFSIHFNYMLDTFYDGEQDTWLKDIYHKADGYETSLLLEPYKNNNDRQLIDLDIIEYLNNQNMLRFYSIFDTKKELTKFFKPNKINLKIAKKVRGNIQNLDDSDFECLSKCTGFIAHKFYQLYENNNTFLSLREKKKEKICKIFEVIEKLYNDKKYDSLTYLYIVLKVLSSSEKLFHSDEYKKIKDWATSLKNENELLGFIKEIKLDNLISKNAPNYEVRKIKVCIKFINKKIYKKSLFTDNLNKITNMTDIKSILKFIPPWIDVEWFENDKSLKSLSSGEKSFFTFIINLMYQVQNINDKPEYNSINLFLDETELGLHPKWQKEYLLNILKALNEVSTKQVHIFFASHSPFLLSDIPNKKVIFLDKFDEKKTENIYPTLDIKDLKNGNCINVSKHKELQTFGANIHTLLSDGFFMSDGLMGEFAKEKINQVYNFIVQKDTNFIKTKKEAQNIINLIGEPLIKKQLQKLFDETFDKSNLTLDDEIELLEKKLNALKELKNDKN